MASIGSLFASLTLQSAAFDSGLRRARRNASQAGSDIDRSMGRMANSSRVAMGAMGAALGGLTFGALFISIAKVNTEFQRLSGQLQVATGSVGAAAAQMQRLQVMAATTPFALSEVTTAFVRLKNLGLDPSEKAMKSYGNTAASMGTNIMQFIEAVADASTGEFERLKEYGIKASSEGDRVKFVFRGMSTEIGKNANEIQEYLKGTGDTFFAGAMDKQAATLGGAFSNLGDTFAQLAVTFGQAGFAPALEEAMRGLSEASGSLENFAKQMGWLTGTVIGQTVSAITWVVENVDILVNALSVVAAGAVGLLAAKLVGVGVVAWKAFQTAMVHAAIAAAMAGGTITRAGAASMAAMSLMGRGAGSLLAIFGGPLGAAVMAVGTAMAWMGIQSMKTEQQMAEVTQTLAAMAPQLEEIRNRKMRVRLETDQLTATERAALSATAALTGDVHLLADAYGRAALEAKRLALETMRALRVKAMDTFYSVRSQRMAAESSVARQSLPGAAGALNYVYDKVTGQAYTADEVARLRKQEGEALRYAQDALGEQIRITHADPLSDEFSGGGSSSPAPAAGGKPKKEPKKKAGDPYSAIRDQHEFESRKRRLNSEILRAQESQLHDYVERATKAHELLDLDEQQALADLAIQVQTKEISKEKAAILEGLTRQSFDEERKAINADQAWQVQQEALQLSNDALERQKEMLGIEAGLVTTAAERRSAELRILAITKRQEKARLEALSKDERATMAAREDADARLLTLDKTYAGEESRIRQQTMGPLESLFAGIPQSAAQMNEALESVAAGGIKSIEDGLLDAITGAKSLGEAFTNVTNQIIRDLARIMFQKLITGALSNAIGGLLGGGSVSTGMAGVTSNQWAGMSDPMAGFAFGGFRAAGGPVSGGTSYWVGEKGPELFTPTSSGKITPNHRAGGGQNVSVHVDARGASNPAEVEAAATRAVMAAAPAIMEGAKAKTMRELMKPRMN